MKPSFILAALITAFVAPAAAMPTNAVSVVTTDVAPLNSSLVPRQHEPMPDVLCELKQPEMLNNYKVVIRKVAKTEVPHLCHLLWNNLRRFQILCLVSSPSCEPGSIIPGEPALIWKFTTAAFCNSGCIASAYWESTHNKYGVLDQRGC
ncbi:hypothetical protein DHEL01_v207337 [Diaporthe helianthi]|uniref:Uncharacterized protein n=1 Tax=Diaporthe helianthi TaxID=158607 RepID=A0A2P5HVK8_DIAHE|nr:hypothetical protein DHEL01_v207337 [Diaporthe helianthi]